MDGKKFEEAEKLKRELESLVEWERRLLQANNIVCEYDRNWFTETLQVTFDGSGNVRDGGSIEQQIVEAMKCEGLRVLRVFIDAKRKRFEEL